MLHHILHYRHDNGVENEGATDLGRVQRGHTCPARLEEHRVQVDAEMVPVEVHVPA